MQVVGLILRILSRAEVNWEVVLCVVSITLHLLPEADGLMHLRYQAIKQTCKGSVSRDF